MSNIIDPTPVVLHFVNAGLVVLGVAALILVIITCIKVIRYLDKKEKKEREH